MIYNWGVNLDKGSKISNRARLRRLLQAAIIATVPGTGAQAADFKPIPAPKPPREAPAPAKDISVKEILGAMKHNEPMRKRLSPMAAEDPHLSARYTALKEQMRGVHLRKEGPPTFFKQFDDFCNDLFIFCMRFAEKHDGETYESRFSAELFARIEKINRGVNGKVAPKADIDHYGVVEKWTVPGAAGDCEDYALLKMLELIYAGIDPKNLHLLVVRDEKQEGHAVLGVDVLENGAWNTLVLDNKHDGILTLEAMDAKYEGELASFVTRFDGELRVKFYGYIAARGGK